MRFYIEVIIFTAIIPITFWMGTLNNKTSCTQYQDKVQKLQQEITILKTKNSAMEWQLADERRKQAAFEEIVRMNMKGSGNETNFATKKDSK